MLNYSDFSVEEANKKDSIDTLTIDIPLFIRLLEYAREDAKNDVDLHNVAENALSLSKTKNTLAMKDYEKIVGL